MDEAVGCVAEAAANPKIRAATDGGRIVCDAVRKSGRVDGMLGRRGEKKFGDEV